MSIILAIQTNEQIIVAGDNRLVEKDNSFIADDAEKLHEINEHLIVASAGNRLGDMVITNLIKRNNQSCLFVDDAVNLIREFYDEDDNILKHIPTCFIISGLAQNGARGIVDICIGKGKPVINECLEVLHSPIDVSHDKCKQIYYTNKEKNPKTFYIETIRDISEISEVVSKSCDVWKFDINSCVGNMNHIL